MAINQEPVVDSTGTRVTAAVLRQRVDELTKQLDAMLPQMQTVIAMQRENEAFHKVVARQLWDGDGNSKIDSAHRVGADARAVADSAVRLIGWMLGILAILLPVVAAIASFWAHGRVP
jgi:hypothetical protein